MAAIAIADVARRLAGRREIKSLYSDTTCMVEMKNRQDVGLGGMAVIYWAVYVRAAGPATRDIRREQRAVFLTARFHQLALAVIEDCGFILHVSMYVCMYVQPEQRGFKH